MEQKSSFPVIAWRRGNIIIIIIIIITIFTIFTFFVASEAQKTPEILLIGTFVKYV